MAISKESYEHRDMDVVQDSHDEEMGAQEPKKNDLHSAAGRSQAATDRYGNPLLTFDAKAEARLRWKIDLYVVPPVSIIYLFCFIDRANIGNARLAGLEDDLNLTGYDYNMVLSIFYISYILLEIPGVMACKKVGPGWFIPAMTLGFGISSLDTAFVHDRAAICGVRFILGVFEAPILPGIAYYLSRWYRRSELVFRLSLYIVMTPLAGAFGGLLASGILSLDHFGSLTRWRMIFAIEGIVTIAVGLLAFLVMTDRPSSARWLSEEEKDLAISRIKSERVGTTEVLDKADGSKTLKGIFNPITLSTSIYFLLSNITAQGLAFFAPTVVRTIYPNAGVIQQQLHTVPPYILGAACALLFPLLSWKTDKRNIYLILTSPFVAIGYAMFVATMDAKVRYGAIFVISIGAFTSGSLCNAQVSANVLSDTARSSAIGTNVMLGNIGGLISTWSFLPNDGPTYYVGNGLNLATGSAKFLVALALGSWMAWDNRKRAKVDLDSVLEGLSEQQIQDLDWRNPAFRWRA